MVNEDYKLKLEKKGDRPLLQKHDHCKLSTGVSASLFEQSVGMYRLARHPFS
jgi:hypothetical protein